MTPTMREGECAMEHGRARDAATVLARSARALGVPKAKLRARVKEIEMAQYVKSQVQLEYLEQRYQQMARLNRRERPDVQEAMTVTGEGAVKAIEWLDHIAGDPHGQRYKADAIEAV